MNHIFPLMLMLKVCLKNATQFSITFVLESHSDCFPNCTIGVALVQFAIKIEPVFQRHLYVLSCLLEPSTRRHYSFQAFRGSPLDAAGVFQADRAAIRLA